jgi:hypothetical protein
MVRSFVNRSATAHHNGVSPPDTSTLHNSIKLLSAYASSNTYASVGLENHILEQLLVHIFFQHGCYTPQMPERDRSILPICKKSEGLLDFCTVSIRIVLSCVEFQGADGEEWFKGCIAVVIGIENRNEFLELCVR